MSGKAKYPGITVTTNGNQLIGAYTEPLICDGGIFYPITPSTEMGENFQMKYAQGTLNAFGESFVALETEGEHAAQGGAIAFSVTGKRVVNFTSGQGIVYGLEQYYHAPGKLCTMVLEAGARALTKHALNVHCGHDDVYATFDTGWLVMFGKDAQQVSDHAIILRKVTELSLNPGINVQDGFLTTHVERTFKRPEPAMIREFLGHPADMIDTPTEAQRILFGAKRRRVPEMTNLKTPMLLGPVQNQEHHMNGVAARRNNFSEEILGFFEQAYDEFAQLTGRRYNLVDEYNCDGADTVFVALGCAAENLEAHVDYIKETRGETVGVIHVNVMRPFPENAVIKALRGKKNVIVLERTDEPLGTENPLTRDIRTALAKAASGCTRNTAGKEIEKIGKGEMPEIFSGFYGLGSRDFRPEGAIGAYDFVTGKSARKDGRKASDGERFFVVGIDHPYAVLSDEKPSCLPEGAIAVRMHSIGGWGMITTGKNLGEIIGEFSTYVAERDGLKDEDGNIKEVIHVSANPKYGSEKKGAPTNYFLVAAPDRIRVNCDLQHVGVVLCCDPKIFLHTNPIAGLEKGGVLVWESSETDPAKAWQRIPKRYRQEIIDKQIRLFILPGFEIAKAATNRPELQLRMQGNAFLGAFFGVSPFLDDFKIPREEFLSRVNAQYNKKFGRFGEKVVASNMTVMQEGMDKATAVPYGSVDDPDTSSMCGAVITPIDAPDKSVKDEKPPVAKMETFDAEFRAGLGYNQPSSPLASVGMVAAGTGATASKYVARREVPHWNPANCTQCMECISICPDTALPNTAQDISTIFDTMVKYYVSDSSDREKLSKAVADVEAKCRAEMNELLDAKNLEVPFQEIAKKHFKEAGVGASDKSMQELFAILDLVPAAYQKTAMIFKSKEKKEPGAGGLFHIFVSDLCKGCGACVVACGDHNALTMQLETEDMLAQTRTASAFLELLDDTDQKYLGLFKAENPEETKAAAMRYHLMMRSKYTALVAGDGGCAGCGEKSALRPISTITEALMRPMFHKKAERLRTKAKELAEKGASILKEKGEAASVWKLAAQHLILGLGGTDTEDTKARIAAEFKGSDEDIIKKLVDMLEADAYNHRDLQTLEGRMEGGMCVMAMTSHTGCNSVYGSTPPNNPHPYPWMNSLFQDGVTIAWTQAESFLQNHARNSVVPERLADLLLKGGEISEKDYFTLTHFTDYYMTDQEVMEAPKVWAIGGDGGMGDIGFQNLSKVVMQNRPNVKVLMLNTQVYSNTGGQNSDHSVMTGGFDMNQFGAATEGKMTEMKDAAECFLGGHGSPFLARVSMANAPTYFKSIMDALCYRGVGYVQAYTPCQPEHGVGDAVSAQQASWARDGRGMPEFIYDPRLGETVSECLSLKGNPDLNGDWAKKNIPGTKDKYDYTVAHWAFTEARFRRHHKVVKETDGMVRLEDKLKDISQTDVVYRRFLDPEHKSYVPDFGVYAVDYKEDGTPVYRALSRQMVLFCVERRKSWRRLQGFAGIENADYKAQKEG